MLTATALITAFYTGRQLMLVFWGEPRTKDARHAHEADWTMRAPLIVLAVLALIGGALNWPKLFGGDYWLEHWLEPSVGKHEGGFDLIVALAYALAAAAALGVAFGLYRYGGRETSFKAQTGWKSALNQGWWIDQFYNNVIVKGFMAVASALAGAFDPGAVDGTVNGVGRLFAGVAQALRPLQSGYVRSYGLMMLLGVVALLAWFVLGAR
jgi:NADH-quinone oxidoreductase subunit L